MYIPLPLVPVLGLLFQGDGAEGDKLPEDTGPSFMDQLKEDPVGTLWPYLEGLVWAIAIFVIGRIVVKMVTGVLRKVMAKANVDEILINFLASIASGVMMLFVIIGALDKLGVPTGSMVALGLAMNATFGDWQLGVWGLLASFAIHFVLWKLGIHEKHDGTVWLDDDAEWAWVRHAMEQPVHSTSKPKTASATSR